MLPHAGQSGGLACCVWRAEEVRLRIAGCRAMTLVALRRRMGGRRRRTLFVCHALPPGPCCWSAKLEDMHGVRCGGYAEEGGGGVEGHAVDAAWH